MDTCRHSATVGGIRYPIAYNLAAIGELEKEFGGLQAALDATGTDAAIKVFECLVKGAKEAYWDPDVPFPEMPNAHTYACMLGGEFRKLKADCAQCVLEDGAVEVAADPPEGVTEKKRKPSRAK